MDNICSRNLTTSDLLTLEPPFNLKKVSLYLIDILDSIKSTNSPLPIKEDTALPLF